MKAIVCRRYGVLDLEEIAKPTPADDEVLVRVRAASVNAADLYFAKGKPYFARLIAGIRRPRFAGRGVDVAGEVEAIGRNVKTIKPGDAVFGVARGAFAEYACPKESKVAIKPANVTFEQAASTPVAASTALQGLRDKARVQPRQKVLVHGAGGGVGTFAVQIAKSLGAEVTAVTNTANADLMRTIGADHVIDYTREDFTRSGRRYDVIFECHLNGPLAALRRVLEPHGTCIVVGAAAGWLPHLLRRWLAKLVFRRLMSDDILMFVANINPVDLAAIATLVKNGKIAPVIGARYPLARTADAMRDLETGNAHGKLVITI